MLPCRQLAWLGLSPPQSRLPVSIPLPSTGIAFLHACSRRDRSLCPKSRSSPPRRRRKSRDPSAYSRDRSPFHRARSPFPRDRSPSYRSGRSPRGRFLSSRPSRTSPYCPLCCSRAKSPSPIGPSGCVPRPSPVGPSGFMLGPTTSPRSRRSWRSPTRRSCSSSTGSGCSRCRQSADQRLLLLSAQPSRYSVQDRDTNMDMPNLDPPTVPSTVKHPLTLEDFQKIIEDSNKPPP